MSFVINFKEEDAFPLAKDNFIANCGFKPESEKHQKMLADGMLIREKGVEKIDIKALLSVHGPDVIREDALEVAGVEIGCNSLFFLNKEKVRNVICYIITVNECGCESEELMDRLYADFWGSAYVDAAFSLLRGEAGSRYIGDNEAGLVLSEPFGPGYYGMPTEEIEKFFLIMDGEKIGVKCLTSRVMVPVKSCAGFLLVMEKGAGAPESCCRDCLGNRGGCRLCRKREVVSP